MAITCTVWWAAPLANDTEFHNLLDDHELLRLSAYRKDIDRRRFLTGRVVAKTVIGELFDQRPESVIFTALCAECGKHHGPPRLANRPVEFSISHSGTQVGVALTISAKVGLDVEEIRTITSGMIDYALNSEERIALHKLGVTDEPRRFFVYWTRKEALMKASGQGLKIPLHDLTVSAPGEPAALIKSAHPALTAADTYLADLDPRPGYQAAVAVLTGEQVHVVERQWHP